jgi:hypothetical protein
MRSLARSELIALSPANLPPFADVLDPESVDATILFEGWNVERFESLLDGWKLSSAARMSLPGARNAAAVESVVDGVIS